MIFEIPVVEYQSSRAGKAVALPGAFSPFLLKPAVLTVSTVRSILCRNPTVASRKLMAAIVGPTHAFAIDWRRLPKLKLNPAFHGGVRDFSLTSRVGELAQGVSYAYWKWVRGYSWISDFGPWVAGLHPPVRKSKLPDFVMFNPIANDLAAMECKGTQSNCHKRSMNKALRQCAVVNGHSAFSRGYGSVLTMATRNVGTGATLHIRDPEAIGQASKEWQFQVFLRSYASWFDIAGDHEMARYCRSSPFPRVGGDEVESDDALGESQSLANFTATALGFDPLRTSFSLDTRVTSILRDFRAFAETDLPSLAKDLSRGAVVSDRVILFPDGTRIAQD